MASGATGTWGRPYPVAGDTPAVHTDVQALANSLDTTPLFPTTATVSRTAVAGESAVCSASITLTLPSAPTKGDMLRATATSGVTGATAVTVTAAGGKAINGRGLAAGTSFKLGTPFAHATLQYDGANWLIVDGEQDTGWLTVTLINGATVGSLAPQGRLRGDEVRLKGDLTLGGNATFATVPAVLKPTFGVLIYNNLLSVLSASGNLVASVSSGSFGLGSVTYTLS